MLPAARSWPRFTHMVTADTDGIKSRHVAEHQAMMSAIIRIDGFGG